MRPSPIMTEFRFSGAIEPAVFAAFAADRVRLLSLHATQTVEAETVVVRVAGDPDLVDMFEMACLIGPAGNLVTAMERRPLPVARAA
jgi:hypothetical protein